MSVTRQFFITPALMLAVAAAPAHAGVRLPFDGGRPGVVLDEAQRLVETGQFRAAERAFRAIAERMKAEGKSPTVALRGAATTAYLRGDDKAAAQALDDLAASAAEFGDPETQVNALLDAALLYQGQHDQRAVTQRVACIRRLLESPVLSEATRQGIASRIVGQ